MTCNLREVAILYKMNVSKASNFGTSNARNNKELVVTLLDRFVINSVSLSQKVIKPSENILAWMMCCYLHFVYPNLWPLFINQTYTLRKVMHIIPLTKKTLLIIWQNCNFWLQHIKTFVIPSFDRPNWTFQNGEKEYERFPANCLDWLGTCCKFLTSRTRVQ